MMEICFSLPQSGLARHTMDHEEAAREIKSLEALFGPELAFYGHPITGAHLMWVEASGDELDMLKDLLVGAMLPRYVDGVPKLKTFRLYGAHAGAALYVYKTAVLDGAVKKG